MNLKNTLYLDFLLWSRLSSLRQKNQNLRKKIKMKFKQKIGFTKEKQSIIILEHIVQLRVVLFFLLTLLLKCLHKIKNEKEEKKLIEIFFNSMHLVNFIRS